MRILHTSDWHLGQHFIGKTRQAEHRALIAWLLEQVSALNIDAVLLAGDVFDTGAPPSYARELYHQLLAGVAAVGASLLVVGGNHDSAATLGEIRPLLGALRATVIPSADLPLDEQVVLLPRRDGQPGALVCAAPFIRPRDVLRSQAGQDADDKQGALQAAITQHYHALYQRALARRAALGLALPIIATGHLTTVGASASESVREIYVGALEAFPTQAFPPVDYLALGHIHRPQCVGGLNHIRYSGSPLALSFDEADTGKQMWLLDFAEGQLSEVSALPVPCAQALASLSGDLVSLPAQLAAVAAQGSAERPVWLEVRVRGDDYLSDLAARVAALADGLPVEILRVRRERGDAVASLSADPGDTLDALSPLEVFERRLAQETLTPEQHDGLLSRYRQVLAELAETA